MKNKFPAKHWKLSSLSKLIKKIDTTGSIIRQPDSGRLRTVRTLGNLLTVQHLILHQENEARERKITRKISMETGISLSTVRRIIKWDLHLKVYKSTQVKNKEKVKNVYKNVMPAPPR